MTLQATIWSGRKHAEEAVSRALLELTGVDRRLWLVHNLEQVCRLISLAPGIEFKRITGGSVPQYGDRGAHTLGVLRAVEQLWPELVEADCDVLLVDDDCQVPTATVERLRACCQPGVYAASGLTRCNDGGLSVFQFSPPHRQMDSVPPEPVQVEAVGTPCFYLTRDGLRALRDAGYQPAASIPGRKEQGWDLHLCWSIAQAGGRIMLDPSVRCRHWVECAPGTVRVIEV